MPLSVGGAAGEQAACEKERPTGEVEMEDRAPVRNEGSSLALQNAQLRAELATLIALQAEHQISGSTAAAAEAYRPRPPSPAAAGGAGAGSRRELGSGTKWALVDTPEAAAGAASERPADVDRAAAGSFRAALVAKDDLVAHLQRELTSQRQQVSACEGRIGRLESQLKGAFIQHSASSVTSSNGQDAAFEQLTGGAHSAGGSGSLPPSPPLLPGADSTASGHLPAPLLLSEASSEAAAAAGAYPVAPSASPPADPLPLEPPSTALPSISAPSANQIAAPVTGSALQAPPTEGLVPPPQPLMSSGKGLAAALAGASGVAQSAATPAVGAAVSQGQGIAPWPRFCAGAGPDDASCSIGQPMGCAREEAEPQTDSGGTEKPALERTRAVGTRAGTSAELHAQIPESHGSKPSLAPEGPVLPPPTPPAAAAASADQAGDTVGAACESRAPAVEAGHWASVSALHVPLQLPPPPPLLSKSSANVPLEPHAPQRPALEAAHTEAGKLECSDGPPPATGFPSRESTLSATDLVDLDKSGRSWPPAMAAAGQYVLGASLGSLSDVAFSPGPAAEGESADEEMQDALSDDSAKSADSAISI